MPNDPPPTVTDDLIHTFQQSTYAECHVLEITPANEWRAPAAVGYSISQSDAALLHSPYARAVSGGGFSVGSATYLLVVSGSSAVAVQQ